MEVHNEGPPIRRRCSLTSSSRFATEAPRRRPRPGLAWGCLSRSRSWQHMAGRSKLQSKDEEVRPFAFAGRGATRNHPPDRNSRIVAQTKARLRKGFRRRGAVAALAEGESANVACASRGRRR